MRQHAKTLWFDRTKYVHLEFCVEESKDVKVDIEDDRMVFSCKNEDGIEMYNEIILYDLVQPKDSRERRSDRSITCFLRKRKEKVPWPRLTKDTIKLINKAGERGPPPTMDDLDDLDVGLCMSI
ncbi:putative protein PTGES3L isoform X4 [Pleurodeles waltl]|uniref:putative protein PTGES3L isoform X4 n=1 Tax=Pleurodeles waltl TaxID=8319 RepID=UPI003709C29B